MSDPFLSEIKIVGFNFAPRGWAQCDGQILPINQNQSLYSLLGTTYGGDGRSNFSLPDLRGRVPMHFDGTFRQGNKGGEEDHIITAPEMPVHTHAFNTASAEATQQRNDTPNGGGVRADANIDVYRQGGGSADRAGVSYAGGGQQHENMQPYTVLNFCIALQGTFPSRN